MNHHSLEQLSWMEICAGNLVPSVPPQDTYVTVLAWERWFFCLSDSKYSGHPQNPSAVFVSFVLSSEIFKRTIYRMVLILPTWTSCIIICFLGFLHFLVRLTSKQRYCRDCWSTILRMGGSLPVQVTNIPWTGAKIYSSDFQLFPSYSTLTRC